MISVTFLMLLLLLSRFSRVQLCNPVDGSPPGSAVPGVLQARTLEWVAIYFSNDFTEGLIAGAGKAEVGGGWRLEKVVKRQLQQFVVS